MFYQGFPILNLKKRIIKAIFAFSIVGFQFLIYTLCDNTTVYYFILQESSLKLKPIYITNTDNRVTLN